MRCAYALASSLWITIFVVEGRGKVADGPMPTSRAGAAISVRSLQRILGVPPGNAELLRAVARALAPPQNGGGVTSPGVVDNLVEVLNTGADPDGFSNIIASGFHVYDEAGGGNGPDWQYGNNGDRMLLIQYLWSKARGLKGSSPGRAARMARAAILLGAHEGFLTGQIAVLRLATDPEFPAAAELSDEQSRALHEMAQAERQREEQYSKAEWTVHEGLWDLVDHPDRLNASTSEELLKRFDAARREATAAPDRYTLIRLLWLFRNFAVSRKDGSSLAVIDRYIQQWRKEVPEVPELPDAMWLSEAAGHPGRPPRSTRELLELGIRPKG